ncbi:MAG: hypothetical protein KBS81_07430, partial [Spirochaetales bacterium]|nr:hypothetical protein [Candidatus Physcosoma equi]
GKRNPSPVPIDDIRGVQEWFSSGSDEKVAIFEDVEDTTEGAKNSLLKMLEGPDPHSHMILISSNPQKLMQPIRSRVRKFQFPALTERQISELLKNRFHAWQNYRSFDAFFFQTGSGEDAQKELEEDVLLFVSSILSGKMMKKTEEDALLSSLEKLSAYRYFKERVAEELEKSFRTGKTSAYEAKRKLAFINQWILSSDIYNMSDKNALDLMLREAEVVK